MRGTGVARGRLWARWLPALSGGAAGLAGIRAYEMRTEEPKRVEEECVTYYQHSVRSQACPAYVVHN